jgi:hypothetical protein
MMTKLDDIMKTTFDYEHCLTQEEVRQHIQECEGNHTQQAIYSTYHDTLTQICFVCKKIRSNIYIGGKDENTL